MVSLKKILMVVKNPSLFERNFVSIKDSHVPLLNDFIIYKHNSYI